MVCWGRWGFGKEAVIGEIEASWLRYTVSSHGYGNAPGQGVESRKGESRDGLPKSEKEHTVPGIMRCGLALLL